MTGRHAPAPERFWAKVDLSGECWLWTAATYKDGYGHFWDGTIHIAAHRFAYEQMEGLIPEGHQLDHRTTCPKNCVRPDHLRPVTNKQNAENRAGAQVNNLSSGIRGITWDKVYNRWRAKVWHDGKCIYVGLFYDLDEAEMAVIAKRNELFTHNDLDRQGVS